MRRFFAFLNVGEGNRDLDNYPESNYLRFPEKAS